MSAEKVLSLLDPRDLDPTCYTHSTIASVSVAGLEAIHSDEPETCLQSVLEQSEQIG